MTQIKKPNHVAARKDSTEGLVQESAKRAREHWSPASLAAPSPPQLARAAKSLNRGLGNARVGKLMNAPLQRQVEARRGPEAPFGQMAVPFREKHAAGHVGTTNDQSYVGTLQRVAITHDEKTNKEGGGDWGIEFEGTRLDAGETRFEAHVTIEYKHIREFQIEGKYIARQFHVTFNIGPAQANRYLFEYRDDGEGNLEMIGHRRTSDATLKVVGENLVDDKDEYVVRFNDLEMAALDHAKEFAQNHPEPVDEKAAQKKILEEVARIREEEYGGFYMGDPAKLRKKAEESLRSKEEKNVGEKAGVATDKKMGEE